MTTLEYTIYAGEAGILPFNFAASDTDGDYDLTGVSCELVITEFGRTNVELTLDARPLTEEEMAQFGIVIAEGTTAAEAGVMGVPYSVAESSSLAVGLYNFQFINVDQPLMLQEGLLTVKPMFAAEVS